MSNEIKILPVLRFPEFEKGHGWEKIPLKQVLEIRNEQAPQSEDYPLMAFVKNEGVAPKGDRYNRDFLVHDKEGKKYKRTEYGDFIYSSNNLDTGSIGLNRYGSASISPVYSIFRVKHSADSEFIGRLLIRPSFVNKMLKFRQGVVYGQLKIHENDVLKIKVAIPSFQEQQKIASCLSSLDELIAAHNDKLDALKDHKKGLMQNLFPQEGETVPKVRFPEFEGDGEWDTKTLDELGELVNGLTYSPKDVRNEGLLVLRSSNIQNGIIDFNDCVYVRSDIKGANLSRPKDILICVRNGSKRLIGKNAIIPENIPLATHGAFMTVFRASNPDFVFQLFQSDAYDRQVKADLGATINSINGKNFIKYEFAVPSNPQEQQKIASCLSSLDEVIEAQVAKIEQLKLHKKGLMQGLFPKIND